MTKLLVVVLVLAACGAPSTSSSTSAITSSTCIDPAAYGAVPDDRADDSPAFRLALTDVVGGGRVCIGVGRWTLGRPNPLAFDRFASVFVRGEHIEIQGAGPTTVLEVLGDQNNVPMFLLAIESGARDIVIRDLAFDASGATNLGEQTHAIEVGTGVGQPGHIEDVRIQNVRFDIPMPTIGRAGDCLRLVGASTESTVRRVTVIGNSFARCARSGIALQRNVFDLVIQGNQFWAAGDQDVDTEPSGTAADLNGTTLIDGNVFHDDVSLRPTYAQGDWAVTIGGAVSPMYRVVVTNNIFEGRGLYMMRLTDAVVSGNTFTTTNQSGYAVINGGSTFERISITGNVIRRAGVEGAAIKFYAQSNGNPGRVDISHNVITQDTPGHGIELESMADMTIAHNDLHWTVPAPAAMGIRLRPVTRPSDMISLVGNRIRGAGTGLYLGASPDRFGALTVTGNMVRGATTSLRCDFGASFNEPVVFANNNFTSPSSCASVTMVGQRP